MKLILGVDVNDLTHDEVMKVFFYFSHTWIFFIIKIIDAELFIREIKNRHNCVIFLTGGIFNNLT